MPFVAQLLYNWLLPSPSQSSSLRVTWEAVPWAWNPKNSHQIKQLSAFWLWLFFKSTTRTEWNYISYCQFLPTGPVRTYKATPWPLSQMIQFSETESLWENVLEWNSCFLIPTSCQLWRIEKELSLKKKKKLNLIPKEGWIHRRGQKQCPLYSLFPSR